MLRRKSPQQVCRELQFLGFGRRIKSTCYFEIDADGLIWQSKRDPYEQLVVLWGDPRSAATGYGLVTAIETHHPLAHGLGNDLLEAFLTNWRLYLEP